MGEIINNIEPLNSNIQQESQNGKKYSQAQLAIRVIIPVLLFGLYMLSFKTLYFQFGQVTAMLVLIPVCASAWIWGFGIGVAVSLLVIPIQGYLFMSIGMLPGKNFTEGIPSFIINMLVAALVGWLSQVSGWYKKLAMDYRQKQKELETEILMRKKAEDELSQINSNLQLMVEKRTKELIESRNKAEESNRLKSDFLTQISHEIRTPISNILNYSSILKEETSSIKNDLIEYCFSAIENSSSRLIRTIDMIVNLAQLRKNRYICKPKTVDVETDILRPLVRGMFAAASNKGIQLKYEPAEISRKIETDEYALTQILDNLLDNAIKFTNRGSVQVKTLMDKEKYSVVISDTGIGISEEYMKKLFEPFSQEETGYTRRYEGNGLGLAMAKKYCELINARIIVKSKKGLGSEFKVELN